MKIGIVGSESAHAKAFANTLRQMGIEAVISDTLQASSAFDGVMVTARDGRMHKELALPWIARGVPLWIDKPFAVDSAQAEDIINAATARKSFVTGGSTCKFAPDVLSLSEQIRNGGLGEIRSAMLNFPAALDSPYNGLHFYASHLVEMALTLFGYDMREIAAFEKNGGVVCLARYNKYDIVMNFQDGVWDSYATVLGTEKQTARKLDLSNVYSDGVCAFIKMIKTGIAPVSYDKLLMPVKIVNAIERSINVSVKPVLYRVS
jgi:predicted dehydrogenase